MEVYELLTWYLFLPPPSRRFRPDKEDGVVEVVLFHV